MHSRYRHAPLTRTTWRGRGSGVGMTGPEFVRVIPEERGVHGSDGAIVLAHIRYRCQTDGLDRFLVDGVRWWRVSLADLASELHMSRDVVKRTMKRLGDAVSANHFAWSNDRTLAYHVPPYGGALTSQRAESHHRDQPKGGIAPPSVRIRTTPGADPPHIPLSKEVKEGEEGNGSGGHATAASADSEPANSEPSTPAFAKPGDEPSNPHPPEERITDAATPGVVALALPPDDPSGLVVGPPGLRELVADPEPPRGCRDHPDNDAPDSCPPCKAARLTREAWEARQPTRMATLATIRRGDIVACKECDGDERDEQPPGWWLGTPDDRPALRCPHPALRQAWWRRERGVLNDDRRAS